MMYDVCMMFLEGYMTNRPLCTELIWLISFFSFFFLHILRSGGLYLFRSSLLLVVI